MKLDKNTAKLICELEYLIGDECYNPNSYDGWTGDEGCSYRCDAINTWNNKERCSFHMPKGIARQKLYRKSK